MISLLKLDSYVKSSSKCVHPLRSLSRCLFHLSPRSTDQWEVDPGELTLGQEIGSGQFGLVLEGRLKESKVAVKMIREECMSDEEFKEEAKIMM